MPIKPLLFALCSALAAMTVTAGCGGDDNAPPSSTAGSSSAAASQIASASATVSAIAPGGKVTTNNAFSPNISMTTTAGFSQTDDNASAFGVGKEDHGDNDPGGYLAAFPIDGIFEPVSFNKQALPSDVAEWLSTNPDLEVLSPPKDITIGGVSAKQLDVRATARGAPTKLFSFDDGDYTLDPLEPARLTIAPTNAGPILIAGGPERRAFFSQLQPAIDQMLASIKFPST